MIAIREVFYAIQGEGARAGEASVFLRMAGCNLNCWFCDTDWAHGDKFSVDDAVALVERVAVPHRPAWVTLTGGEPCVAPDFDELVAALIEQRYKVSVETNGTRFRSALHACHVVVSPKSKWEGESAALDPALKFLDVERHRLPRELKLVVEADDTEERLFQTLATVPFTPTHYYLQPRYDDRKAWQRAYDLVRAHPTWRLSLQLHKWLGCR